MITPPKVATRFFSLPYHKAPLSLYRHLAEQKSETMLFESADIEHQHAVKSLLITQSALRITAEGEVVTIHYLTDSGAIALNYLKVMEAPFLVGEGIGYAQFRYPKEQIDHHSPLDLIRHLHRLGRGEESPYSLFIGGLFGYDLVELFKGVTIPDGERQDLCLYLAEEMVVIDHKSKTLTALQSTLSADGEKSLADHARFEGLLAAVRAFTGEDFSPKQEEREISNTPSKIEEGDPEAFLKSVASLRDRVRKGEFKQIVPSRRFTLPCNDPLAAYIRLKEDAPSPYLFYLQDRDFILFGASPESALKYHPETRSLELYPIAGTKPRGRRGEVIDPELDSEMAKELLNDPKEVAEHLMLVDLAVEDLSQVAEVGSVHIAEQMKIDRYAYVMHLVSRVTATLAPEFDPLDAYLACMNMGTLTGSPKVPAMEAIYEYEEQPRGPYGGAIGYLDGQGRLDTAIVIRSAVVRQGRATVQAGAGIVADSEPHKELEETTNKANAIIRAIEGQ